MKPQVATPVRGSGRVRTSGALSVAASQPSESPEARSAQVVARSEPTNEAKISSIRSVLPSTAVSALEDIATAIVKAGEQTSTYIDGHSPSYRAQLRNHAELGQLLNDVPMDCAEAAVEDPDTNKVEGLSIDRRSLYSAPFRIIEIRHPIGENEIVFNEAWDLAFTQYNGAIRSPEDILLFGVNFLKDLEVKPVVKITEYLQIRDVKAILEASFIREQMDTAFNEDGSRKPDVLYIKALVRVTADGEPVNHSKHEVGVFR